MQRCRYPHCLYKPPWMYAGNKETEGRRTHATAEDDAADDELREVVGRAGERSANEEADAAQQHGRPAPVSPACTRRQQHWSSAYPPSTSPPR